MLGKEGAMAVSYSELTRAILRLKAVREIDKKVIFDVFQ